MIRDRDERGVGHHDLQVDVTDVSRAPVLAAVPNQTAPSTRRSRPTPGPAIRMVIPDAP